MSTHPFSAEYESAYVEANSTMSAILKWAGRVYVDSYGRERWDRFGSGGATPEIAWVSDPITGRSFVFNPSSGLLLTIGPYSAKQFWAYTIDSKALKMAIAIPLLPPPPPDDAESLGRREIEGLLCDGYRYTSAAEGAEWWVSVDIAQPLVYRTDNRDWKRSHTLFNITMDEPDPSIFVAPGR